VDGLERGVRLSLPLSSELGNGGVVSRSLSLLFPLAPRVNSALSAPELFLSDRPDVFLPISLSSGVLIPFATPRSRCAAFCIALSSFLLGSRSASTDGLRVSREGRSASVDGRRRSSDRRPRKGGVDPVEPCREAVRKRFMSGPDGGCVWAESSTVDGGVLREVCLPLAGVGDVLRSWSREERGRGASGTAREEEVEGAVLALSKEGRLGEGPSFIATRIAGGRRPC
jgi:hypothetical protein